MKNVFIALTALQLNQAIALKELDERVSALESTLLFQYPQIADDLKIRLADEQQKNVERRQQLQKQFSELQATVSSLPD